MSNRIKDIIDGLPPRDNQTIGQCIEMIYDKITEEKGRKFSINDKEITYIDLYIKGKLKKKKIKKVKKKWTINFFEKNNGKKKQAT